MSSNSVISARGRCCCSNMQRVLYSRSNVRRCIMTCVLSHTNVRAPRMYFMLGSFGRLRIDNPTVCFYPRNCDTFVQYTMIRIFHAGHYSTPPSRHHHHHHQQQQQHPLASWTVFAQRRRWRRHILVRAERVVAHVYLFPPATMKFFLLFFLLFLRFSLAFGTTATVVRVWIAFT
jgi:hypothetical protein